MSLQLLYKMPKPKKKPVFKLRLRHKVLLLIIVTAIVILLGLPFINNIGRVCFEDNYCIKVEINETPEDRARGLMFREELDEGDGMLFVFDKPGRYGFWMKNMLIPIDIIFLNKDRKIVHIFENVPPCSSDPCPAYVPKEEVLYVVETKAGFSERHDLEPGQSVFFSKKVETRFKASLKKLF